MTDPDDGFVARWSRRKRGARVGERADPAVPARPEAGTPEPEGGMPEPAPPAAGGELAEAEASDLPDPDTLDADADFTVFLKDNVPEAIRRRALRRLWRLNPVFANLDGLNDYDDDFTDAATVVAGLKTLYKVGKGFVTEEEEAEKADDPPAESGPGPDPDPGPDPGPDPDETSAEAGDAEEEAPVSAPRNPAPAVAPPMATAKATPAMPPRPPAGRRGARARRWGGVKD